MNVSTVTVLICTYNRSSILSETLDAILAAPRRSDYDVELIVVDNNSTDGTRDVVEQVAARAPIPVRCAYEPRQGKSFALNHGLQMSRGDVIAHTDDDVWPEPEWLDRIVDAFRANDITFAFGKVLPRWSCQPPPELLLPRARDIWGPLAILDYGDERVDYLSSESGQHFPVGANLAFRRQTLIDIGGWRTDLGKVNNTLISGEDHEIFHRLRRLGGYRGLYDPSIAVRHYVPARRLTRTYFRRWFYWHGKTLARMPQEIFHDLDPARVPHVFGVPRFFYRQFFGQVWNYARVLGGRDALSVLIEELRTVRHLGYFAQCWEWSVRRNRGAMAMPESGTFLDGPETVDQHGRRVARVGMPPPKPIAGTLPGNDSNRTGASPR
jgi:glucosyl-dolichyl phosphate glucuronosyltransferase